MKIVKKYFVERQFSYKHQQYYSLLEIVIWIIFAIWALKTILEESIYYTVIVIVIFLSLAIWITWFVVKDFIAGLVFKLNDNYQKGQFIEVNDIKGYIEEMNYLTLDLISETGETIKIPYSKIQGNIHKKSILDKSTIQYKFELQIPKNYSFEKAKGEIKKAILLTPGVDLKEPIIKIIKIDESFQIIEIVAFILNNKTIDLLLSNIESIEKNTLLLNK